MPTPFPRIALIHYRFYSKVSLKATRDNMYVSTRYIASFSLIIDWMGLKGSLLFRPTLAYLHGRNVQLSRKKWIASDAFVELIAPISDALCIVSKVVVSFSQITRTAVSCLHNNSAFIFKYNCIM